MSSSACKNIAGELQHPITIQQVTRADDGQGGFTETWSTWASPWAKIEPVSANQVNFSESLQHRVTHKITIRYRSGLSSDMRIVFGSRTFHIQSFRNLDEGDRYLEIMAEEGKAA